MQNKVDYLIWYSSRLDFVKISTPNPVESFGYIENFEKNLNTHKKTNRVAVFSCRLSPSPKYSDQRLIPSNLENKIRSDKYWKVHLVCIKVQAHISSEPPIKYNLGYDLFNQLGS